MSSEDIGGGITAHYDSADHPMEHLRTQVIEAALEGCAMPVAIDVLLTVLTTILSYAAVEGGVDPDAFCDGIARQLKVSVKHDIGLRKAEEAGTQ